MILIRQWKLYKNKDLDKAMKEERQERLNWLKNVKEQFSDATRTK